MAEIERMTITLPSDMVAVVRGAVDGGDYASNSEVMREALRDWKMKRALQLHELAALKADIDRGLTDLAEGRVQDFDATRIIERGRKLLAGRSTSAPTPPTKKNASPANRAGGRSEERRGLCPQPAGASPQTPFSWRGGNAAS